MAQFVRFKIMADGHSDYPSFFSDHIILNYNIQHPRNVPQIVLDLMTYDELYQYVQASLPTEGVGDFWRHHMEIESNHSTEHVYFLELSRARGPEGIILAAHILEGLNVFERIGYFRMGRVALGENIDLDRGQCCPEGERDWDWDGGLERNTSFRSA
ncbi:hypothetical protein B0O99DRAFT_317317 [Bisporella sp. PMI_857]|nr:hypothetical protein B0O99DRAFT_317317 [Bisporella sp. PMI_857]